MSSARLKLGSSSTDSTIPPFIRAPLERYAGLEVEAIRRRELSKEIRTVGKLDDSERQMEFITSRVAGRGEAIVCLPIRPVP